jgi:hypothetical protein
MSASHLEAMRNLAANVQKVEPELIEWFRYGTTYVVSLLSLIDFYNAAGRHGEAHDVLTDLQEHLGAADNTNTIVRNLLRLGYYWDEEHQVRAARQPGIDLERMLDIVRTPFTKGD